MLLLVLFTATITLSIIYIFYISSANLDYWKKRGVKHVKPLPFFGNVLPSILKRMSLSELIRHIYDAFPNERYVGIYQFTKPILMIRDPDLIKTITIKNFENFVDHGGLFSTEADPLWGKSLFASKGERWRDLRQTLSPAFTSSKMRSMFILMDECAKQLTTYFKNQNKNLIDVELKDVFARYTTDVIATTAFGIKCDSLKHKDNDFLLAGRKLANFTGLKQLKFLIYGNFPQLTKFFNMKIVEDKVGNFFRNIIDETISLREEKKIVRPDLIHLMMLSRKGKLKYEDYLNAVKVGFADVEESGSGKSQNHNPTYLSNEDITAQAVLFFFGGFDTASNVMAFLGYELAVNTLVQEKLRQEILKTHKASEGSISYEQLLGMKYLDMVISETLRKWPQGTFLDRKCTKSFEIQPERNHESVLKINEGDSCWIPVYGLHMDPKYYPNPDRFDPERFSDENVGKIPAAVYLPFGLGPRNCIGSRFALLETKILLYHLLLNFEFVPTRKTQIPLKISKGSTILTAEKKFWLAFKLSSSI